MEYEMVKKLAEETQRIAEEVHCASAIIAVETMLHKLLIIENSDQLKNISKKIAQAERDNDNESYNEYKHQKQQILSEIRKKVKHIRVTYEDISKGSARHTIHKNTITIVLPKLSQDSITSINAGNIQTWTENMRMEKDALRRLTAHELGHIIINAKYNVKSTELDATNFQVELMKMRKQRNNGLYTGK